MEGPKRKLEGGSFLCSMKAPLLPAFFFLLLLGSCGSSQTDPSKTTSLVQDSLPQKFREIPDWIGVFQDTLPCQDCLGALTRIAFYKDGQYHKSVAFLGKEPILDHTYGFDGKWTFDPARNLIQLDSIAEKGNYFFRPVGDSLLIACLPDGQVIDGGLIHLNRVSVRELE